MDPAEARRLLAEAHIERSRPVASLFAPGERALDTGPVTWLNMTEQAQVIGAGEGILVVTGHQFIFYNEEPTTPLPFAPSGPAKPGRPPDRQMSAEVLQELGAVELEGRAVRSWSYGEIQRTGLEPVIVEGAAMVTLTLSLTDGSTAEFVGGATFLEAVQRLLNGKII